MSEIDIFDAQCFTSWGRHLDTIERFCAVRICVVSWVWGRRAGRIDIEEVARLGQYSEDLIRAALCSMLRKGVLRSLSFLDGAEFARVELAPRWRMDEETTE